MPISEKKLKVSGKSHYSHEIRKDVDLADLNSLKLEDAWPFIREEIEKEIGSDRLVCVPYITEANLYSITSVFLKSDKAQNGKLYQPLGKLTDIIDESQCDPDFVNWLKDSSFADNTFKFKHDSVKITLQDEQTNNKVRVIMLHFSRLSIPKEKSLVKNICLSQKNKMKGVKSIYMITDILMAKTVEFRVNMGTSSRIFHLGNPTPLVFGFEQFDVNDEGRLISKIPASVETRGMIWNKVWPYDRLCTSPTENFTLKV